MSLNPSSLLLKSSLSAGDIPSASFASLLRGMIHWKIHEELFFSRTSSLGWGTVLRNYNKNLIKLDKMEKWDIWKLVLSLEIGQHWLYSPQLAFRTKPLHFFFTQRFQLLYWPLYWTKSSSCPRALEFRHSQRSSVSSKGMVCTKQRRFQQASRGFKRQQRQQQKSGDFV